MWECRRGCQTCDCHTWCVPSGSPAHQFLSSSFLKWINGWDTDSALFSWTHNLGWDIALKQSRLSNLHTCFFLVCFWLLHQDPWSRKHYQGSAKVPQSCSPLHSIYARAIWETIKTDVFSILKYNLKLYISYLYWHSYLDRTFLIALQTDKDDFWQLLE